MSGYKYHVGGELIDSAHPPDKNIWWEIPAKVT